MVEIGGIQKLTLIDYPGHLAATVFLFSCNFRCPFCYSSELVLPEKMKEQPRISRDVFLKFLKEKKGLLEGIVICGGEPTVNDDLPEFIEEIKKEGYLVKLDTNGSNPEMLENLIKEKLIDYVAMDIKASKENYYKANGWPKEKNLELTEKIEKSIKILKECGIGYEFRSTIVPTIHDEKEILEMAKWIGPAKKYYLQGFRPEKTINPDFEKIKPFPEEWLIEVKEKINSLFEVCRIR